MKSDRENEEEEEESDEILRRENCASVCANQASGQVVQKVGSLSVTASKDMIAMSKRLVDLGLDNENVEIYLVFFNSGSPM